ncbi:MAG: DUF4252 domain-containing protein [Bacteroidales bacterium]|jgi:hypothetical protein
MKKTISVSVVLFMVVALNAQTNAVDEFFDKYSEKDGFTLVTISGKLLGLFSGKEVQSEKSELISKLSSIRILSSNDSLMNLNLNFYKELTGRLNMSVYEELMAVKEGKDETRFLVRQKGDRISELLVISGGPGSNTLISIRGDIDLKSLAQLSDDFGIEGLENLEKMEQEGVPK